jgi:peptidoglycan/LPS O-acetylase OafA/YrhL
MKATAMGNDFPPPEQATSWDEFHDRIDWEWYARTRRGSLWNPLWMTIGALLFVAALVLCAYATEGGHWWLWLVMLAPLAIVGVMVARVLDKAERNGERLVELDLLERAWAERAERSPIV